MKQNYNRSIKLVCVTCGSDSSFSTDEQTGIITCKKCNRVYYDGKDELMLQKLEFLTGLKMFYRSIVAIKIRN